MFGKFLMYYTSSIAASTSNIIFELLMFRTVAHVQASA